MIANATRRGCAGGLWFAVFTAASSAAQEEPPWRRMDYGPFLTTCLEVGPDNFAYKGIAIRLDGTDGGIADGAQWMVFDTDTLRWAAGWRGAFIDWRSIVYDGSHQTHAKPAAPPDFATPQQAGWAQVDTDDFDAPRTIGRDGRGYGPIPQSWGRYRGLWAQDGPPILHYEVGGTEIWERAGGAEMLGESAFLRELEIAPHAGELRTRILRCPSHMDVAIVDSGTLGTMVVLVARDAAEEKAQGALDGTGAYRVERAEDFEFRDRDFSILARIRTRQGGTILAKTAPQDDWAPDGTTFFVRNGRLCYDVGWVGVVQSRAEVADGRWHEVAMNYSASDGTVRLYVDGELDGQRELRPREAQREFLLRLGYTARNFPEPSAFTGEIAELRFYQRRVAPVPVAEAGAEELIAAWRPSSAPDGNELVDLSGNERVAVREAILTGGPSGSVAAPSRTLAVLVDGPASLELSESEQADVTLVCPPASQPSRLRIAVLALPDRWDAAALAAQIAENPGQLGAAPVSLSSRCVASPTRWPEEVVTESRTLGPSEGPWVVDDLSAPLDNPFDSWFRIGDFDFSADGDRAAVATWMGDVWWVSGLLSGDGQLRWRRFAAGLYQPLGLKIVDHSVYVLGRDQITRLHDLDGDGEADHYECFHHDLQVTEHFHEFAMGLQTDAEGNFYLLKGARHALDSVIPQHGTLIRVPRNGGPSEVLARGFRAPNGLCVNEDGSFYTSDQEGHWTPANCIKRVVPGGFYGYRWGYVPDGEMPPVGEYERPVCWIDHDFDRSPAAQLWVTSKHWGPLEGQLLTLSYGTGKIALVLQEEVDGTWQGGVTELPIATSPTGIMRARFHPVDGQLYVAGLFGWSSQRTLPGAFHRVRWTDTPVALPVAVRATTAGLALRFTQPLAPERTADLAAWEVRRWNYRYAQRYGSDDFRVSDGAPGREDVEVRSVRVSPDGRAVLLQLNDFQPCDQMLVRGRLRTQDGGRFAPECYLTVHRLGDFESCAEWFR